MRVLSVVHHRDAAAGVFAEPARVTGHELVEWIPHEEAPPALDGFDAAMVFGAYAQVDQQDIYPWLRAEKELVQALLGRGTPMLGVCFGSQLIAEACGAVVGPAERPEIGWSEIELTPEGRDDPLLGFLPERFEGFGYHHYEWLLPPGAVALARSATGLQAFSLEGLPIWGIQFHAEITLADLNSWFDSWHDDPGAVATGLDPDAIRGESAQKIAAWNDIGRGISARFFAAAAGTLLER
jgi:GMP synthase-like glutamine amidotransferase